MKSSGTFSNRRNEQKLNENLDYCRIQYQMNFFKRLTPQKDD